MFNKECFAKNVFVKSIKSEITRLLASDQKQVNSKLLLVFPFSLTLQLFIWAASSAGLTYLWLVVFKRTPADSRAGSSGEMIGETGLLVKDAGPFLKGELIFQRPILGADRWQCIAETHLRAGARVKVVAVEGSVLKIDAG